MSAAEWSSEAPVQPPVVVEAAPMGATVGTEPRTPTVRVPPFRGASSLAGAAADCGADAGLGADWHAASETTETRHSQRPTRVLVNRLTPIVALLPTLDYPQSCLVASRAPSAMDRNFAQAISGWPTRRRPQS